MSRGAPAAIPASVTAPGPSRRGLRVALPLLVSAALAAAPPPARAESPVLLVPRIVRELRAAQSDGEALTVLRAVLDSLGVRVVAGGGAGEIVGVGGASTPGAIISGEKGKGGGSSKQDEPPTLYEAEVMAVVHAFRGGSLIPLEEVVALWAEESLTVRNPGGGRGNPTGNGVEAAMRAARKAAEVAAVPMDGFVIRLVDELGHRRKYPFDLLRGSPTGGDLRLPGTPKDRSGKGGGSSGDEGDGQEPLPQDAADAKEENLRTGWTEAGLEMDPNTSFAAAGYNGLTGAMRQGLADEQAGGDAQGAAYLQSFLGDTSALHTTYRGMARGGNTQIVDTALEQAVKSGRISKQELAVIKAKLAMGNSDATQQKLRAAMSDPRMPAEQKRMIEAAMAQAKAMQTGDFQDMNKAGDQMARAQTEFAQQQVELRRKMAEEQAAKAERARTADAEADAVVALDLGEAMMQMDTTEAGAVARATREREDYRKQEMNLIPPDPGWEKLKPRSLPPPMGSGSALLLDPVQALLLNYDLFGFTRPQSKKGGAK